MQAKDFKLARMAEKPWGKVFAKVGSKVKQAANTSWDHVKKATDSARQVFITKSQGSFLKHTSCMTASCMM